MKESLASTIDIGGQSPKLKVEPDPIALLGAGFEITVLKIFGHFIKNVLLFLRGERKWKY